MEDDKFTVYEFIEKTKNSFNVKAMEELERVVVKVYGRE